MLVVDARRGVGNGRVIPAGPLRAPLDAQLARAQALVLIGTALGRRRCRGGCARAQHAGVSRTLRSRMPNSVAALGGGRVLAFAGIGDPEKFFATLARRRDHGGRGPRLSRSSPLHAGGSAGAHREADREGLMLMTTEKDLARINGDAALAELAAHVHALPVTLAFDDEAASRRCCWRGSQRADGRRTADRR